MEKVNLAPPVACFLGNSETEAAPLHTNAGGLEGKPILLHGWTVPKLNTNSLGACRQRHVLRRGFRVRGKYSSKVYKQQETWAKSIESANWGGVGS